MAAPRATSHGQKRGSGHWGTHMTQAVGTPLESLGPWEGEKEAADGGPHLPRGGEASPAQLICQREPVWSQGLSHEPRAVLLGLQQRSLP